MSLQSKNIYSKIKRLEKDSVIDVGNYINKILPEDFQNFIIKETILRGSTKELRITLNELLYILKRDNRDIFQQVVGHINSLNDTTELTIHHELTTKKINGSLNEVYIKRLYQLFEQISEIIGNKNYKECLKEGYLYFLRWNKIKTNLRIFSLERVLFFDQCNEIDKMENLMENKKEYSTLIDNFFQSLEEKEIKILFLGFFFWGKLNQTLKESNETIYILIESLPKINLKIFEILSNLSQNLDNTFKDITKFEISEIYNDIYDKTEGFKIKIEPWLIY